MEDYPRLHHEELDVYRESIRFAALHRVVSMLGRMTDTEP